MNFICNDGGRSEAGFKGSTGDCCCRAIAIAAELPYQKVYDDLIEVGKKERKGKRKRSKSHPRTGVYKSKPLMDYLEGLGFRWVSCMQVGTGCQVHLKKEELPEEGRLVLRLSRHFAAFIDGSLWDTYDCSRNGTRCVYGYWIKD